MIQAYKSLVSCAVFLTITSWVASLNETFHKVTPQNKLDFIRNWSFKLYQRKCHIAPLAARKIYSGMRPKNLDSSIHFKFRNPGRMMKTPLCVQTPNLLTHCIYLIVAKRMSVLLRAVDSLPIIAGTTSFDSRRKRSFLRPLECPKRTY